VIRNFKGIPDLDQRFPRSEVDCDLYLQLGMAESLQNIVDTHVHFVDPARFDYPWLATVPSLCKAFGPSDYSAAFPSDSVTKLVFVETNVHTPQAEQEAEWIDSLALSESRLAGIVAFADLATCNERERTGQLERLLAKPRVRAIRHNIEGQPKGFCLQRSFIEGVRTVHRLGGHFELCITPDQLDDVLELVRSAPDGDFVINHGAKPSIKCGLQEPWQSRLAELASCENVFCKISGLFTVADLTRQSPDAIRPFVDHIAECFGHHRVMYGSDWPVCTLAASAVSWLDFVQSITVCWSEPAQNAFYHDNAIKLYRI
jgi:L-fuconolactonase